MRTRTEYDYRDPVSTFLNPMPLASRSGNKPIDRPISQVWKGWRYPWEEEQGSPTVGTAVSVKLLEGRQ